MDNNYELLGLYHTTYEKAKRVLSDVFVLLGDKESLDKASLLEKEKAVKNPIELHQAYDRLQQEFLFLKEKTMKNEKPEPALLLLTEATLGLINDFKQNEDYKQLMDNYTTLKKEETTKEQLAEGIENFYGCNYYENYVHAELIDDYYKKAMIGSTELTRVIEDFNPVFYEGLLEALLSENDTTLGADKDYLLLEAESQTVIFKKNDKNEWQYVTDSFLFQHKEFLGSKGLKEKLSLINQLKNPDFYNDFLQYTNRTMDNSLLLLTREREYDTLYAFKAKDGVVDCEKLFATQSLFVLSLEDNDSFIPLKHSSLISLIENNGLTIKKETE